MAPSPPDTPTHTLPAAAARTLADPSLRLELHGISFSHYVERARWALRLLGLPYTEVGYLPMLHISGILRLQKKFRQGPGKPTASSKSPAATPCLAIYTRDGQPLCLIQDSEAICRYAALRAAALQQPQPRCVDLYGSGLALAPAAAPEAQAAAGDAGGSAGAAANTSGGEQAAQRVGVVGGDARIRELEQRLSGTMGVEVRRTAYHYLLPATFVGSQMYTRNTTDSKLVAWFAYFLCRLLLPRALAINDATAARGGQRLRAEFDFFDAVLLEQQANAAQAAQQDGNKDAPAGGCLPYYLTGSKLSAADVSLACLAGALLCVPHELCTTWMPPLESQPLELKALVQELQARPTGQFVLRLWQQHGPRPVAAGASPPAGWGARL